MMCATSTGRTWRACAARVGWSRCAPRGNAQQSAPRCTRARQRRAPRRQAPRTSCSRAKGDAERASSRYFRLTNVLSPDTKMIAYRAVIGPFTRPRRRARRERDMSRPDRRLTRSLRVFETLSPGRRAVPAQRARSQLFRAHFETPSPSVTARFVRGARDPRRRDPRGMAKRPGRALPARPTTSRARWPPSTRPSLAAREPTRRRRERSRLALETAAAAAPPRRTAAGR